MHVVVTKFKSSAALVLTALTALVWPAVMPGAQAAVTIRVAKAVPEQFTFTVPDIGQKEGIFAKYGVNLNIISFTGDAKMQEGLASDSVEIGLGGGPAMAFVAKGAPVMTVAAFAGAPRDIAVAVKANSPIKTVAQLRGKKVAVSTVGSLTYWLAHQISIKQGWGNNGIDVVATGAGPAMISALITGEIDAGVTTTGAALVLEEKHEGRILATMDKFEPRLITHVIFARREFIKQHPKEVENFLKGFFATVAYMRTHKAETVAIASAVLHQSPKVIAKEYDTLMPEFLSNGEFDPVALKTIKASFVGMKMLPKEPSDSQILTRRFVPVKF